MGNKFVEQTNVLYSKHSVLEILLRVVINKEIACM